MPFISSIRKDHNPETRSGNAEHLEITGGDVVYTAGGYRIHMFTSVGEAELSIKNLATGKSGALNLQSNTTDLEYLIVGGGAAGGTRHGGGGGAGGMIVGNSALNAGNIPVVVGGGGPPRTGDSPGINGQDSSFAGAVALGGGGGGNWRTNAEGDGKPGGSGGGAGRSARNGAPAEQERTSSLPYSFGFGNRGGNLTRAPSPAINAGGGGGAGTQGTDGRSNVTGVGGSGAANSILGTNYFWAAGGGGAGGYDGAGPGGPGGVGGGGGGAGGAVGQGGGQALNPGSPSGGPYPGVSANTVAGAGGANTGSGGGGANQVPSTGGAGGSGIVVVRYPIN